MLAHLGDGGVTSDHRHDPLVVVVERLHRFAVDVVQDVLRRPLAGLQRDRSQLRERPSVRAGDVRDVADDEDPRMILDRQIVPHVDPPAAPLLQPDGVRERRGLDPAAPDHAVGGDRVAVGQHDVVRGDLLDLGAEADLDAAVA